MTARFRDLQNPFDGRALSPAVTAKKAPARSKIYRRLGKRIFDIVAVLLGAPIVIPILAILALIVYCHDRCNPFYSQIRVGKGGCLYRIWKLRTMVVDAESTLGAHLAADPSACQEWETTQKLKDDPRVTRFGRVLRKSSLDELPQLWNVFKGDMSLVGPRPIMPEQCAIYPGEAYYRLLPGITGPWQVSERNASTFAARADFDTDYESSLSLVADLNLLFATVRVVTRGTGY
ncbi:sugar transferase [Tabrizicola sp. WMC-M-20]|nr:sugar transferase [Tabrizicola sp. WMC-M-20]